MKYLFWILFIIIWEFAMSFFGMFDYEGTEVPLFNGILISLPFVILALVIYGNSAKAKSDMNEIKKTLDDFNKN
tara:strand:+ start:896 stop:1117 length:222 start_codon:yes stop_codon:yes gene_type:complete